jgi:hypothetical protein
VDLAEIRQQITNLVGNDAVGMVEITMDEVGKGHYLGMKHLFEMIGLYPALGEAGPEIEFDGCGAAKASEASGTGAAADRYQRSGDGAGGFRCSGLRIEAPLSGVDPCFVFGRSDPTVAGRTRVFVIHGDLENGYDVDDRPDRGRRGNLAGR